MKPQPRAFTLVELLAVLIVISILAGMVVSALAQTTATARKNRAESQIVALREIIGSKMEAYITRRMPMVGSDYSATGYALEGPDANRQRLTVMRNVLRYELPDRKSDLVPSSVVIQSVWTRRKSDGTLDGPPQLDATTVAAPPAREQYRRIVDQLSKGTNFSAWTEQYEGSECLYLILATTQQSGRSGLEFLPSSQIRDTDGDGVPEILDPWGTPMVWIRWPVGYWLTYENRTNWMSMDVAARMRVMTDAAERAGADQFDILDSDWRSTDTNSLNDTFNIQPLIVSAGPDQLFDLMLRSRYAGATDWNYGDPIVYGAMAWPVGGSTTEVPTYGELPHAPSPPHVSTYYYIDPYAAFYHGVDYLNATSNPFAVDQTSGLPGAFYDANGNGYDESTDNIYSSGARWSNRNESSPHPHNVAV